MKLNYIKELDGVRAFAALMVMFFHFFQNLITENNVLLTIKKFSNIGQTGVSLFFVLSGFLITRILLNTKRNPGYFKNFYLRRAVRIFPLYYLFLIIYNFILPIIQNHEIAPFSQQLYYWVYLQNFAITFDWPSYGPIHYWSLGVEEHFYFLWPLLIYFLSPQKITISIILLIILSFITRYFMASEGYEVFYFTVTRMDELALGAYLAILERKGKLNSKNSKYFLLLLLLVFIPSMILWNKTTGSAILIIQVIKYFIISLTYFFAIGYIISLKNSCSLKTFLRIKPLLFTGKISYGLYVYHSLGFLLVEKFVNPDSLIISFILCFFSAYLISTLSFYLFEEKFLLLKKRFEFKTQSVISSEPVSILTHQESNEIQPTKLFN